VNSKLRFALIALAIVCLGVALSYPVSRYFENRVLDDEMGALRGMKQAAQTALADEKTDRSPKNAGVADAKTDQSPGIPEAESIGPDRGSEAAESGTAQAVPGEQAGPDASAAAPSGDQSPSAQEATRPIPEPTPFAFDEDRILPEYKPLYEENRDLVGWLRIDGTVIDYPVLQREDEEFYLTRDFYGRKNANGQLILDAGCDPFAPSLNLVISGHNMKSGKMFGGLQSFARAEFARRHPVIEFDTLFRRGQYRVVAAFYTWDYEARPDGFRYNVDIRYRRQLSSFLEQLDALKLYDTGVSVEFGDELIILSTCSYQTGDGRFAVVARRLRPGEQP